MIKYRGNADETMAQKFPHKYGIWVQGGHYASTDDLRDAIISFCMILSKLMPKMPDTTIGFNPTKYGPIPVMEGYRHHDGDTSLVSVLYNVTIEDWDKHGPPRSLELSEEERKKRGLFRST